MTHSPNTVLEPILEAILNAAEEPLSVTRLLNLFPEEGRPERETIQAALDSLAQGYADRGVELVKIAGGYRLQTCPRYGQWIEKLYETKPPRLSRALLETLAIIAYRQPVSRGDIQEIRGVSVSSDIMQRLLERDWIRKVGERETPGRPSLYATTNEFLSYFNLEALKDLPELKAPRELDDIAKELNQSFAPALAPAEPQEPPEDQASQDQNKPNNPQSEPLDSSS